MEGEGRALHHENNFTHPQYENCSQEAEMRENSLKGERAAAPPQLKTQPFLWLELTTWHQEGAAQNSICSVTAVSREFSGYGVGKISMW